MEITVNIRPRIYKPEILHNERPGLYPNGVTLETRHYKSTYNKLTKEITTVCTAKT